MSNREEWTMKEAVAAVAVAGKRLTEAAQSHWDPAMVAEAVAEHESAVERLRELVDEQQVCVVVDLDSHTPFVFEDAASAEIFCQTCASAQVSTEQILDEDFAREATVQPQAVAS